MTWLTTCVACVSYMAIGPAIIVCNKWLLVRLPFPILLLICGQIATSLFTGILLRCFRVLPFIDCGRSVISPYDSMWPSFLPVWLVYSCWLVAAAAWPHYLLDRGCAKGIELVTIGTAPPAIMNALPTVGEFGPLIFFSFPPFSTYIPLLFVLTQILRFCQHSMWERTDQQSSSPAARQSAWEQRFC